MPVAYQSREVTEPQRELPYGILPTLTLKIAAFFVLIPGKKRAMIIFWYKPEPDRSEASS